MAEIELDRVSKTFSGDVRAVDDVSVTVHDGDFMVLVGPSGCGKSTLLRMIAGLEDVTHGSILIDGTDVTDLAPRHRDIAMVFQSYALYPHMTVRENMAYGLKVRRAPKPEIARRVGEVASMLGLADLLDRRPAQLSGGQRQRVAMGRAIRCRIWTRSSVSPCGRPLPSCIPSWVSRPCTSRTTRRRR
jgi:ABC-type sugar transport system ATPase subunit